MRFPATNARAIEVDRCSIANDGVVNHAGPSGQQRESQREQHHCNEGVLTVFSFLEESWNSSNSLKLSQGLGGCHLARGPNIACVEANTQASTQLV